MYVYTIDVYTQVHLPVHACSSSPRFKHGLWSFRLSVSKFLDVLCPSPLQVPKFPGFHLFNFPKFANPGSLGTLYGEGSGGGGGGANLEMKVGEANSVIWKVGNFETDR